MKNILLVIKGFFIGIANVIPGVSGGTIALILGIYEDLISSINNFFKDVKKHIKFLLPLGIGMILSVLTMSKAIGVAYEKAPVPTFMFFVGLVIGGIPLIKSKIDKKKKKNNINYVIGVLTFLLVVFLASYKLIFDLDFQINLASVNMFGFVLLFLVGMITSATMVIPGISGSLVLMILGYYYPIINMIRNLLSDSNNLVHNFLVLGVFGVGLLVGIVLIAKLIERLLERYKNKTYFGILGFIYGSIVAIPISTFVENSNIYYDIYHIIGALITLAIGITISYKLSKK